MINGRISELNPGNDQSPVIEGEIPCQPRRSELKEIGNQSESVTDGTTRKNRVTIILIVVAFLLPAVLDRWTTNFRSTHGAQGLQSQMPVLILNEEKQSCNPELKARDPLDQGTLKEPSRKRDLASGQAHPSGTALGPKAKTRKQNMTRNEPNDRGTRPEGPSLEDTTASHESESPLVSESILTRSSSGRSTALVDPEPELVFPVIHEHTFGSCHGELKLNRSSIAFLPSIGAKHGFDFRLSDITETELGNTLKIRFPGKLYRFRSALASSKENNRARLNGIYVQLLNFKMGVQ